MAHGVNNQYETDTLRFSELLEKFTGIDKSKVVEFINYNNINNIFQHPASLDLKPSQVDKLKELVEMRNIYNNLKSNVKEYVLDSSVKAGEYFKEYFADVKDKEYFACAFLDSHNKIIATKILNHGTVNEAPIYPREIAKLALNYDAYSVILSHNHPSGNINPSEADMIATNKIKNAMSAINVKVQDHIIVGGNQYTSFRISGITSSMDTATVKEVSAATFNVREKIIEFYDKEFPAIRHISNEAAHAINTINDRKGHKQTIDDIKGAYTEAGRKLELNYSKENLDEFKSYQGVVDELKQAQIAERQDKVNDKTKSIVKEKEYSIEM